MKKSITQMTKRELQLYAMSIRDQLAEVTAELESIKQQRVHSGIASVQDPKTNELITALISRIRELENE